MALLSVKEHHEGRHGDKREDQKTYTRQFIVIYDADPVHMSTVATADAGGGDAIPVLNASYPGDSDCKVISIKPTPYGDQRCVWLVRVDYSNKRKSSGAPKNPNPTNDDPVIQWGSWSKRVPLLKDKDGNAIVTKANEEFDPPAEDDRSFPMVIIRRYVSSWNPLTSWQYVDSVNEGAGTLCGLSIGARQAFLKTRECKTEYVYGSKYYHEHLVFLLCPYGETWDLEALHWGYYALRTPPSLSTRFRITIAGQKVEKPQHLNADGSFSLDATVNYLAFRVRREMDWTSLNIPSTF